MPIDALLATWGYPVLFIGTVLEGETIVIAAAFLAHQGVLQFPVVVAVSFVGGLLGDQIWYHLGRRRGRRLLARRPDWAARSDRVFDLVHRYPRAVVIGFRFVYGMRTVTPLVIGMSGFPPWRYTVLNMIGALAWALIFTALGFAFGEAVQSVMGRLHAYGRWIALAALLGTGAAWWLIRRYRARRRR